MTDKEYEQKRRECWEEFWDEISGNIDFAPGVNERMKEHIYDTFDRAYALGKQTETISQEEIEEAAEEYVLTRQQARHNAKREEDATMRDFDKTIKDWDAYDMEQAFESGANLFPGKQENDAEEEEELQERLWNMLTPKLQTYCYNMGHTSHDGNVEDVLTHLFGSKCLPDEEPKPAEPRFKVGDRVRVKGCGYEPNLHKGDIGEILDTNDKEQCFVLFKKSQAWIYFDCLEPYAEPKENHIANPGKMVDAIIKDGLSKERRLNIAAMAMQGMLSNTTRFSSYEIRDLVRISLNCADALIKKAEGGSDE